MAHSHYIVVDDPNDEYRDGSIVSATLNHQISNRGAVTLPVDPEVLRRSGVGGYHRRTWGAGWPLDSMAPRMTCPLTLWATPEHNSLAWVARLSGGQELLALAVSGERLEGQLRLASDTTGGAYQAGLHGLEKPVSMREIGPPDAQGGWTISGRASASIAVEGHYGFALYGVAPGFRVIWAAASLTKGSD